MFDPHYLDRMSIGELDTLADGIDQSVKRCRDRKQWALARWWRSQQTVVMDALYKAHMEETDSRFVRAQLVLAGMPPRCAPDERHPAA